jgi:hypothetical protein
MPQLTPHTHQCDFIEITNSSLPKSDLGGYREKTSSFWSEALLGSAGESVSAHRAKGFDTYTYEHLVLLVFRGKIVLIADDIASVAIAAGLLNKLNCFKKSKEAGFSRLVFRCGDTPDVRKKMSELRKVVGMDLGAVVVAEGTAVFHPALTISSLKVPTSPAFAAPIERRQNMIIQLEMKRLKSTIDNQIRKATGPQIRAIINQLGLRETVADFSVNETLNGHSYVITGQGKGCEFFVLKLDWVDVGSRLSFVYSSTESEAKNDVFMRVQNLLRIFSPRNHRLTVLHMGRAPDFCGGHWQTSPLGKGVWLSLLFPQTARAERLASA